MRFQSDTFLSPGSAPRERIVKCATALAMVIAILWTTPARAQSTTPAHRVDTPESLALTALSHDTAELYGVSLSFIGSAAVSAVYGALRYVSGDFVNADGLLAALGSPFMAGVGLTMLAVAAGIDGGLSWWSGARRARDGRVVDAEQLSREQRGMRQVLTALYVSGVTSLAIGAICVGILWGLDLEVQFGGRREGRIEYGAFVAPGVIGGAGYLMLLAAAGMDGAAAAWSGRASMPSVSVGPINGGLAMSISGAY